MDERKVEGVKHLHGTTYLVKFDLLQTPDPDAKPIITDGHKQYEFRNPRSLTENGQAVLFDKKKSEEIRDSIREKTLMTPFICRWMGDNVQMVGGERRYRAIEWLIHKKDLVKDPRNVVHNEVGLPEYKYNQANEVYEYVLCQIYHANNDLDALALSYTENDCRINQGEGHDIAMVQELRSCGASDEKILAVMSKDEKWLRDTDNLICDLDKETLNSLLEDKIDRDAALEILSIKEKYGSEVATKACSVAYELAQRDYAKKFDHLTKVVNMALDEKEIAEGTVVEAKFKGEGIEEAEEDLDEITQKASRLNKSRNSEKPKANTANVRSGLRTVTDDGNKITALRAVKIKTHYLDALEELVKNEGKHPDLADVTANLDSIKLAIKLVKGILDQDIECLEIVRLHHKGFTQ